MIGKWLSEDPIGFAGGDTNISRYVANRVLTMVDPDGLELMLGTYGAGRGEEYQAFQDGNGSKSGGSGIGILSPSETKPFGKKNKGDGPLGPDMYGFVDDYKIPEPPPPKSALGPGIAAFFQELGLQIADAAADESPLGPPKAIIEGVSGETWRGEQLGPVDQAFTVAGAIPGFASIKKAFKGWKGLIGAIGGIFRKADDVAPTSAVSSFDFGVE